MTHPATTNPIADPRHPEVPAFVPSTPDTEPEPVYPVWYSSPDQSHTRDQLQGAVIVALQLHHNLRWETCEFRDAELEYPACPNDGDPPESTFALTTPWTDDDEENRALQEIGACGMFLDEHCNSIVVRNGKLQSAERRYDGYGPTIHPVANTDRNATAVLHFQHRDVEFTRAVKIGEDVIVPMTQEQLDEVDEIVAKRERDAEIAGIGDAALRDDPSRKIIAEGQELLERLSLSREDLKRLRKRVDDAPDGSRLRVFTEEVLVRANHHFANAEAAKTDEETE